MYAGRNRDGNMFVAVIGDAEEALRRALDEGLAQALAVADKE
jgi:hypothetical protein